jgi:hypothetical protein
VRHPPAPLIDSPPLERYGIPERVLGASPAVATGFTQAIDGAFYARLVSVFCRIVADGNAANREVVLEYQDAAGNRYAVMGSAVAITAGQTRDVLFSAFQPAVVTVVDSTQLIPLQPLLLGPTDQFKITVVNVQVGDQLSRIRFVWERFCSDVDLTRGADDDD